MSLNRVFILNDKKVKALKEICTEANCVWMDSNYGGKRFGFKVSKKFRENNPEFFEQDAIGRVYLESYFKMLSEFNPISDYFIDSNGLKQGHINGIRQSYYSYWNKYELEGLVEFDDNVDDGVIMIDYKRPFGNSYVIGDVLSNFGLELEDPTDKERVEHEQKYEYLIDSSISIIKKYFIEEKFNPKLAIRNRGRLYWQMEVFEPKENLLTKIKNVWNEIWREENN